MLLGSPLFSSSPVGQVPSSLEDLISYPWYFLLTIWKGVGQLKYLPVSPLGRKSPPVKIQNSSSNTMAKLLGFPVPSSWRERSLTHLVTVFPSFPLSLLHHKQCLLSKRLILKFLLLNQDLQEPKERQISLKKLRIIKRKLAHLGMSICKVMQFCLG